MKKNVILLLILCIGSLHTWASKIDTIVFRGDSSHIRQRMCIYTPTGYDPSRQYPVVYLLHGIHGNHYSWLRDGHINRRLDSLIDNHLIEPMVVVMPYCQRFDTTDVDEPRSLLHCLFHYGSILRGEFEATFFEIDDYVRNHYAVSTTRNQRAIAGLSCGARQAAVIAKDGTFEYVGLFCPVIHQQQLPPEQVEPAHYWVGVTEGDVFLYKGRRFRLKCHKRGIPVELYQDKGSHNWGAWRKMVELFLTEYFPYQEND